jgi:hypothetical protein
VRKYNEIFGTTSRGIVVAVILTMYFGLSNSNGETLEIPTEELIRLYSNSTPPESTQFHVPFSHLAITSAQVCLRGNLPVPSYTTCGYNGVVFILEVPGTPSWEPKYWKAEFYVDERVNFEVIAELEPYKGATWDFLEDGVGTLICRGFGRPLPIGCSYIPGACCPIGDVTYASIIFEYDPLVPIEETTWGRIKSLFH